MTMVERAAQFSPFAALTGYGDMLEEEQRETETQTEKSDSEHAELSMKIRILAANIDTQPGITVTYFEPDPKKDGGRYRSAEGRLKKIRDAERELVLVSGEVIPMDAVKEIESDILDLYDL